MAISARRSQPAAINYIITLALFCLDLPFLSVCHGGVDESKTLHLFFYIFLFRLFYTQALSFDSNSPPVKNCLIGRFHSFQKSTCTYYVNVSFFFYKRKITRDGTGTRGIHLDVAQMRKAHLCAPFLISEKSFPLLLMVHNMLRRINVTSD